MDYIVIGNAKAHALFTPLVCATVLLSKRGKHSERFVERMRPLSQIPQNAEESWQALCVFGGDPDLGTDPRFDDGTKRAGGVRHSNNRQSIERKHRNQEMRPLDPRVVYGSA